MHLAHVFTPHLGSRSQHAFHSACICCLFVFLSLLFLFHSRPILFHSLHFLCRAQHLQCRHRRGFKNHYTHAQWGVLFHGDIQSTHTKGRRKWSRFQLTRNRCGLARLLLVQVVETHPSFWRSSLRSSLHTGSYILRVHARISWSLPSNFAVPSSKEKMKLSTCEHVDTFLHGAFEWISGSLRNQCVSEEYSWKYFLTKTGGALAVLFWLPSFICYCRNTLKVPSFNCLTVFQQCHSSRIDEVLKCGVNKSPTSSSPMYWITSSICARSRFTYGLLGYHTVFLDAAFTVHSGSKWWEMFANAGICTSSRFSVKFSSHSGIPSPLQFPASPSQKVSRRSVTSRICWRKRIW